MSLQDQILVNTHYTRSINLERDANSIDVVNAYIPTSRALRTLSKIADAFHGQQSPRAWSLVGPYGSGKSSFSVFLAQLLSHPENLNTKAASRVLKGAEKALADKYIKENKSKNGCLEVLVTGAPEPLGKRLSKGFADAAEKYWEGRKGKKPAIIKQLRLLANKKEVSTSELIEQVQNLQIQLSNSNGSGILLVIDELGKFLEFEARHYGANDIYMLQTLAEHACKGGDANLYMFVLLHQSFEQYAKGLGESLKNEWSKVQGRFEEIPFLESVEQTLRVVSAAFSQKLSKKELKEVESNANNTIKILASIDALPGALTESDAGKLLSGCYPLHPISAILLPLLCQKVAQNERSLFNYLGSHEDFGLVDMLTKLNVGEYIFPHHIYDYFITNQTSVVGDYLTHRRWAEVVTAIERLGDAKPKEVELLKTIGILNIVGSKGGFKASKELLATLFPSKQAFTNSCNVLSSKSVITHRRYSNEYRVWQGSDFDIEAALQEELYNFGNFDLAYELNNAESLLPIVARRYTIKNGALRYFTPYFVDAKSYISFENGNNEPKIIFFIATGKDDEELFHKTVVNHFSNIDLVALCLSGNQLREAVSETIALKRVQINKQELNSDPVAKREFEDRLTAAEHAKNNLLLSLYDHPEQNHWFYMGERQNVATKRSLQVVMSNVLEGVFNLSPVLHNELINRDKPSSTANAARNKLLYAVLNHEFEKDLGIEKFPAEKAIYRSLLLATGLHKQVAEGEWNFIEPSSDKRKRTRYERDANILPVWNRINEFLDSTEKQSKSFAELNSELMAPPYGVKAGVLPILYITAYVIYQNELALYESRRYRPFFTGEMLERFVKRPDEFEFQRFRIKGLKASIFEQYSQVIHGDTKKRSLLELAKPLATFMGTLPEYTQKTRRGVSETAQSVRSAFNLAKSPERLLFQELPKALGFENLQNNASEKELAGFAQLLTEVLRELRNAYSELLNKQKQLLAQAFNIDPSLNISDLRKVIAGKCHGLENFTVDTQGLRAFIMRLTKSSGEEKDWFENVLMFLGHKPTKKWLDSDQDTAEHRLNDFSRRVIDLEALSIYEQKRNIDIKGDFDVYLLRSVKKGGGFKDEVVAVDKNTAKTIDSTKKEIANLLLDLPDKELRLAALAETIDEFLIKYREEQKTKPKQKTIVPSSTSKKLKKANKGR